MKVSAVVITKNEEKNIKACLKALVWADEIVIIDSNSTDNTAETASAYTGKIFKVQTDNFSEKRNLSLGKTSNEWVLYIDADERVTPELAEEIRGLTAEAGVNGYYIGRKNYCFGKWLRHSGVYPDRHIRLFNKNFSSITPRLVHEGIIVNGKTGILKNEFLHFSYSDLTHMLDKINLYSTLEAEEKFSQNRKITKAGVFTHAISAFLRVYISRKGFKDGIHGFFLGFSYSMVNFLSHIKLLKLQSRF